MRARRKDNNHNDITKTLSKMKISHKDTHMIGNGFPDLIIGFMGVNFLVEIKTNNGTLTDKEEDFFEFWEGDVILARNVVDVFNGISKYGIRNKDYFLVECARDLIDYYERIQKMV